MARYLGPQRQFVIERFSLLGEFATRGSGVFIPLLTEDVSAGPLQGHLELISSSHLQYTTSIGHIWKYMHTCAHT